MRRAARRCTACLTVIGLLVTLMPACERAGDEPSRDSATASSSSTTRNRDAEAIDETLGQLQQRFITLQQHDQPLDKLLVQLHGFVSEHPDHPDAHLLLGQVLLTLDRLDAAYESLDRATELAPDRPALRRLAGTVASKLGRYDDAEAHYRAAIDRQPDNVKTRLLLAAVFAKTDRHEPAQSLLEQALAIDSSSHEAHHALAGLAMAEQRFVDARTHARRAIDLVHGEQPKAQRNRRAYKLMLARILRHENRPDDAIDVLRSIDEDQRHHPDVLRATAECYAELGRPEAAARLYERLLILEPANLALAEAAALWHVRAGNLDAARDLHRHAARIDQGAPQTRRIAALLAEAE